MLRNPLNYSRPFSEAEGRVENQIIGWKMDQGYWEISSPTLFPVICRLEWPRIAPDGSKCLRMSFDFPLAGKVENPARTCKMSVHCCNTCRMARKVKKSSEEYISQYHQRSWNTYSSCSPAAYLWTSLAKLSNLLSRIRLT